MVRDVSPWIRPKRTPRRMAFVAATVMAMVVGVGVVPANAVGTDPNDPPDNPCVSNSSGSVSVSPSSVSLGQPTTVHWTLTKPANCPLTGRLFFDDPNTGHRLAVDGSVVTPTASGEYVLVVNVPGRSIDMASASVRVGLPMVNGHPLASITHGGNDQVELFAQGLSTPSAVVTINSNVDLDLSGPSPLVVAPGVRIIGQRDAAHPSGPRLFTTTYQSSILTVGSYPHPSDNVRITGIRFDGGENGDPCNETGEAHPDANGIDVSSSQHVEIDHNEFYHFNGSAAEVYDNLGVITRDTKDPTAARTTRYRRVTAT
jgi:hypothetical protein